MRCPCIFSISIISSRHSYVTEESKVCTQSRCDFTSTSQESCGPAMTSLDASIVAVISQYFLLLLSMCTIVGWQSEVETKVTSSMQRLVAYLILCIDYICYHPFFMCVQSCFIDICIPCSSWAMLFGPFSLSTDQCFVVWKFYGWDHSVPDFPASGVWFQLMRPCQCRCVCISVLF